MTDKNDGNEIKVNGITGSGGFTKQSVPTKTQPSSNLIPKEKKSDIKASNNQSNQLSQNQQKENYFNEQLKAQMNNLVTNMNKQEKRLDDIVQDPKNRPKEEFSNEQLKQQINSIVNNVDKHEKRINKEEKTSRHETISNPPITAPEKYEAKQINTKSQVNQVRPEIKKPELKKNIGVSDQPEAKSKPITVKKEEEPK